jgi:hypothetical protein
MKRFDLLRAGAAGMFLLMAASESLSHELTGSVTELDRIPAIRAQYPVPSEPNMLFYIQRSVNSNTVIYAAKLDAHGRLDTRSPVDAYWRWYNVDGHKKPLNFIERMMAYGINSVEQSSPAGAFTFKIAALPERTLTLDRDSGGRPAAFAKFGNRQAKLVYVYLQVDDKGLMPSVTAMDLFGTDRQTGKPLHEHLIVR